MRLQDSASEMGAVMTPADNVRIVKKFRPPLLKKLGVDVSYCPFGPTDRSIPQIPAVSMVVDLLHRDLQFSISDSERKWREEYFQQLLLDADYIQAISNYSVARLLDQYSLSKNRVFFTYLPIDQRLRYGSGSLEGKPFFIYPANFWAHKNHETLIIAYRLYRHTSTEDPWDLVLTGQFDDRAQQLKRLATTLGIEGLRALQGSSPRRRVCRTF